MGSPSSNSICPNCGKPLQIRDFGACPNCLLTLALIADDVSRDILCTPVIPSESQAQGWIDRYKLLQVIGEGGFGTVWIAEQHLPVRRQVALKIVKFGMDTRQVVARFEAERQALALMDHPNIARVYDGGSTNNGRPYFVMELVHGLPITRYCDQKRLTTRQRIELLIKVCEAVQHAHQKGIIHRDLKPSNLLVTEADGTAVPKVVDFGIAKATASSLTDKTIITGLNQFMGTPPYMSPEQVDVDAADVDTRSDVYSLGVLLYELMVGRTPFDSDRSTDRKPDIIYKLIREAEPLRPSTRFAKLDSTQKASLAGFRGSPPEALLKQLTGELDWIVLKALEKDRTRRYQSASDLAEDLRSFLDDKPVKAAPPALGYRVAKFTRRNRVAIAGALMVSIGLIVATILSVWQAVRATRVAALETQLRRTSESNQFVLRNTTYAADLSVASQVLDTGDYGSARDLLRRALPAAGEPDLRGFEWRALWKLAQGDPAVSLVGHTNNVTSIALSEDGLKLYSCGVDGTVREWDFKERRELRHWNTGAPCSSLALSEKNALLAVTHTAQDYAERIDLRSGQIARVDASRGLLVVAAPNGDGFIRTKPGWGFTSTNGVADACHPVFTTRERLSGSGDRAAFSPDGKLLATATWLDRVKLWSWPSLQPLGDLGPVAAAGAVHFSPRGDRLVVGAAGGELTLWDVHERKLIARKITHTGTTIGAARFAPDGAGILTAGGDQTLRIHGGANLEEQRVLRGYADQVWAVAWSPDGNYIVSTTLKAGIRVWQLTDGTPVITRRLAHFAGIRFSPNSAYFANFTMPRGVALWNAATRKELAWRDINAYVVGFLSDSSHLLVVPTAQPAELLHLSLPDLKTTKSFPLQGSDNEQLQSAFALSNDAALIACATAAEDYSVEI